jgi:hypothetical protein
LAVGGNRVENPNEATPEQLVEREQLNALLEKYAALRFEAIFHFMAETRSTSPLKRHGRTWKLT